MKVGDLVKPNDLQSLNNLIEQIVKMKKANYSLLPETLNNEETLKSLERIRDYFLDSRRLLLYNGEE